MKKLNIINISLAIITLLLFSCDNEFDYGKLINAVKTTEYNNVTQSTAEVSGNVITDNGVSLTARGICYSTTSNPTVNSPKVVFNTATLGNYTCSLTNLVPSTSYYARAYATNSFGTAYGATIVFTTLQATVPIITSTTTPSSITAVSATTGGTISNSGASAITSRGVCYSSTASVPTIADPKTTNGTGIGTFTSQLTGLNTNTTYYIRAYATNSIGTAYGDVKTFSTSQATVPIITSTTTPSSITAVSATTGGTISNSGASAITSRGVCYSSTASVPTIADPKTTNGTGIGTFTSQLTGLNTNTTYYIRAYATNSIGTAYGDVKTFSTSQATIPTGISTTSLTSITQISAISGGTINGDGGSAITTKGVCWSNTNSNPTIANPRTIDGNGISTFSSSLTGLQPGTVYFVRAYATNSVGTAYGPTRTFTTTSASIPIGVSTTSITSITQISAISGGTINGDGGSAITTKGVCWSNTNSNPTIANPRTIDGNGISTFSSSLTGLQPGTVYYVRAYATNSVGTAYGQVRTFTTTSNLAIGQSYQGGIIAYIFIPGDNGYIAGETHGLIATTNNQSTGIQWGCSGTSIAGTSTSLGTGLANTTAIVNGCTTNTIAARLCDNLVSGGYSDWYLPSREELIRLYNNRTAIGGFNNTSYWSSSQVGSTTAWSINFSNGSSSGTSAKSTLMFVRAIRKF